MVQGGGMAPTALPWSEIAGFEQSTGIALTTWEARMIRAMSVAYIGEGRRAEEENCPPPWITGPTQAEIDNELNRLRAVLG